VLFQHIRLKVPRLRPDPGRSGELSGTRKSEKGSTTMKAKIEKGTLTLTAEKLKTYVVTIGGKAIKKEFYGTDKQDALGQFRSWALGWLAEENSPSGIDLYGELKRDPAFESFYFDGKTYAIEQVLEIPPIYRLPVTLTGLDADLDNVEPGNLVRCAPDSADSELSEGCVERYRTADGYLIDLSIDSVDMGAWYGLDIEEEES